MTCAAAATLLACGSATEPGGDAELPPPPGFWPETASAAAIDPALGEIIRVPGGNVRDGSWFYDEAERRYVPGACEKGLSVVFRVSPFRLMRHEVSNRVYGACVRARKCAPPDGDLSLDPLGAGAWDDERRANKPVALSMAQARGFCRAYGGELPSYYQWVRALEGDTGEFGIEALTEAWIRCKLGDASPFCATLSSAPWRDPLPARPPVLFRTLPDVGANAWDVGPFGHRDLFGGAGEWVRPTTRPFPFRRLECAATGLLVDGYCSADYQIDPDAPHWVMHPARELSEDFEYLPPARVILHGSTNLTAAGKAQYFNGFRCAFPPLGER